MALLPVVANKVVYDEGAPFGGDTFVGGLRWVFDESKIRASGGLTPSGFSQGLPVDQDGVLCFLDITEGIPENAQWQNGLLVADDGLCVTTDAMVTYSNGIPLAANGGVCV